MDMQLRDKSALVVGASKGLGRAIALALAQEGCHVATVARSTELLNQLRQELDRHGNGHATYAIDLMRESAVRQFAERVLKEWSAPEIVVHNLGGSLGITDSLAGSSEYRDVWQLNVGIPVELNKAFLPHMQQNNWGRVIHISSSAAEYFSGYTSYVAAKSALRGYVKSLSRNFARHNIVISAVCPGPMFGEGRYLASLQQAGGQPWEEYCNHHLSIGRLATPAEIAPFVTLLCSPLASFAVGAVFNIDGGSR